MDIDMVNVGRFIAAELRAMMIPNVQLYQSGNMRNSVVVVTVNEDFVDIIIATDYASYTNTRGKMAGWIERTIDRCCRAYASNNNTENELISGTIYYGSQLWHLLILQNT